MLSVTQKQQFLVFFECLELDQIDGIWGKQSKAATVKLQRKLNLKEDGLFGTKTEEACFKAMLEGLPLPDAKEETKEEPVVPPSGDFWDEIEFFDKGEFACKCGDYHAPYCDGYPHAIDPRMVRIADRARKHFGVPIEIISGLRCPQHNKDSKGVSNSQHMYGEAADVKVRDVGQQTVLNWFLSQPDVRYAYAIKGSSNVHFDIPEGSR